MTPSYNLVHEPWIPCVRPDGVVEHKGILDTLANAAEFKEIRDPSPLVTAALHRMLLAVLHRVFGPASPRHWSEIWTGGHGHFDRQKLLGYLEKDSLHSRFDLFDKKHPFYQTGSLPLGPVEPKTGRPKFVKPVWQMAHELAYSDSMNLFAHYKPDHWETRPCAEVARWLVAFQCFALGGLITTEEGRKEQDGSADAGQLVKSAVVLAKGDTVFQTLTLNLVHYSADDEAPFAFKVNRDRPAWERDEETTTADRRYDGYLDLLTWQSRRVKLVPEVDLTGALRGASGVVAMKGHQLPDQYWRKEYETMVGFVKAKDAKANQDPWPPLGFRSGKELWRDCHVLVQSVEDGSATGPRILSWVDDCRQRGDIQTKAVMLEAAGMCSDRAKIFFWRHESLPLPLAYLNDAYLVAALKNVLAVAEACGTDALRQAVWAAAMNRMTASSGTNPDRARVSNLLESFAPERYYWSQLELPFRELLIKLPGDVSHRSACLIDWFWNTLRPVAVDAFEQSVGQMDAGRDLKAVTAGRAVLYARLKTIQNNNQIPNREKEGCCMNSHPRLGGELSQRPNRVSPIRKIQNRSCGWLICGVDCGRRQITRSARAGWLFRSVPEDNLEDALLAAGLFAWVKGDCPQRTT